MGGLTPQIPGRHCLPSLAPPLGLRILEIFVDVGSGEGHLNEESEQTFSLEQTDPKKTHYNDD